MNRFRSTALFFAVLLCISGAAGADLLVTRGGITIETLGPWRVEGRQVIFNLPNGSLSSLRADRVDLDQSALATEQALRPPVEAPAAAAAREAALAEPVWRINDEDVTPPKPPVAENEENGDDQGDEGDGAAPSSSSSGPLEVASWDRIDLPGGDGIEIFGTLRNNGISIVSAPTLSVFVYGERGGLLATSDGSVNLASIPPGKSANFRASLPGLGEFAAIKFDVSGRGYVVQESRESVDGEDDFEAPPTPAAEEDVEVDPGAKYDDLADESVIGDETDYYNTSTSDEPPADAQAGDDGNAYDYADDTNDYTESAADEPPPGD